MSSMDFHTYIKAVATGPKSNRDLSFKESFDMMTQVLEHSVYDEQIAVLLTGWRLKPETIEEFRGALAAFEPYLRQKPVPNSIELGYPFDGKRNNPHLLWLIAKAMEGCDLELVVYGDTSVSQSRDGITIKQLYESLEFGKNIHYFDRASYFPKLHALSELRRRIGLRTAFNTIEKLPGVAKSAYAITGVFHKPFIAKYIALFAARYKRLALIQGNEGTPELFGKGRLWIASNDEIEEYHIDPSRYGIEYEKSKERITLDEALAMIEHPSIQLQKLARLNAAIWLFVAQKARSIDEGYEMVTSD